ncbi:uncharacterized protein BP5553_02723 [Venustampulla echinocandica]|uniref:Uncharacterized protein n=1 Tax=Venustampulla echinocandica TaxID=2656787 RepID=A0A370TS96_9HELO|nr:uncharacterized protein BP5553_02723 [Venustampulla echinocandica]RDL38383.1 hypothetical protein BP5553_02723 [Venustampulla echinocandica]
MPFGSSKIQSKLLASEFDDEPPLTPLYTHFALDTTLLDLPSSFHSEPASPSSLASATTTNSFTRYLPSRAAAWWEGEKTSQTQGSVVYSCIDGIDERIGEALGHNDVIEKTNRRAMVEMIGLFAVAAALVGAVVICVGIGMGMDNGMVGSGIKGKA